MSERKTEFNRTANPDASRDAAEKGRPIATKRELDWLIECLDHVQLNYEPPRPPGAPDEWRAAARQLGLRINYLTNRLHGQRSLTGDFSRATQNESKQHSPNPYQKRMLLRREFNDKARDTMKDRET